MICTEKFHINMEIVHGQAGLYMLEEIDKKINEIIEKQDLDDYVNNTCIEDAINEFGQDPYYTIVNKNVTLDKILKS